MTDVVDSDELLRRIQRARSWAGQEERTWKTRSEELRTGDPDGSRDAELRGHTYEAVRRALDEIVAPGTHDTDG
ncbi:hypothetical protein ACFWBR_36270 [Streptomyces sp. NPDC060006]|uniref:hypothetical protein n=1 Tax=unclassified Streptomyces TaxID=2593676 RepID=UPI001C2ECB15|nr:hypothetical protein [Streptomyces sp. BV286]MBV1938826.1 hypothetical protein [Streptomyces sp. BV286]